MAKSSTKGLATVLSFEKKIVLSDGLIRRRENAQQASAGLGPFRLRLVLQQTLLLVFGQP